LLASQEGFRSAKLVVINRVAGNPAEILVRFQPDKSLGLCEYINLL